MKIKCEKEPETVKVIRFDNDNQRVEIELCENIQKEENYFTCDYYSFLSIDKDNLEEEIKNNLQDWLKAARYSETGEDASILRIAKEQALDEYTQKMLESEVSGDGNTDDEGKH